MSHPESEVNQASQLMNLHLRPRETVVPVGSSERARTSPDSSRRSISWRDRISTWN